MSLSLSLSIYIYVHVYVYLFTYTPPPESRGHLPIAMVHSVRQVVSGPSLESLGRGSFGKASSTWQQGVACFWVENTYIHMYIYICIFNNIHIKCVYVL